MKNKITSNGIKALAFGFILLQLIGCGTERANVKYADYKKDMSLSDHSGSGTKLGHVEGSRGGAIWDKCDEKAKDALSYMIASAKSLGATSIGNITWHPDASKDPVCRKNWGFFAMPVFILTPLFMSTKVEGDAYKGGKVGMNEYLIPNTKEEEEKLIQAILADRF